MYVVMILLLVVAFGLHLNPTSKDLLLSIHIRLMRLIFCVSVAIFIPAVIQYTFGDVSQYDLFIFHPVFMFGIGIVFSIGLQLLVYGKLSTDHGK